ncbi:MAG: cytochrome c [Nitrospirae bacterium]|nr:cytochrome c [Nitrospirota bacterium]
MKRTNIRFLLIIVLFFIFSICASSPVTADDVQKLTGMKFVQLARGGMLYDNWMAELGGKIDKTHPSYPANGPQKGPDTWRCKECHGWDYKGKVGDYSKGSHYTGITGIRSYANMDPVEIVKILKNDTHAFDNKLSENDYDALALFVSLGQIDVDLFINRETKKSFGDVASGSRIYLATCIKCHGVDGKEINMSTDKNTVRYIGTVANKNPYETLHKIRWGHPGTPMISLLFLELKEQLDVLAFCQALPER